MAAFLRKHLLSILILVIAVGSLVSCGTVKFYAQAAHGQWFLLHKARPIPDVLADAATGIKVKTKLKLVQELRDFAKNSLHLPVTKQFSDYSDLGRDYAVWVVFAAPELSVEAKTWWYPLVGTLKYRGYFDEKSAVAEGQKLKSQGLDVYVGGTDAYSTLGWFADPVLNTFLRRGDAELAELIFHELTHSKIFIPGDTDFNEALATAVGQAGVRRWLKSQNQAAALEEYENNLAKDEEIVRLLLDTRTNLKNLYEKDGGDAEAKRTAKAAIFAQMQERYGEIKKRAKGDSRYDRFFAKPMNNARLNTVATYHDYIPGFERMLQECQGDLDQFFIRVEAMRSMAPKARRAALMKGATITSVP